MGKRGGKWLVGGLLIVGGLIVYATGSEPHTQPVNNFATPAVIETRTKTNLFKPTVTEVAPTAPREITDTEVEEVFQRSIAPSSNNLSNDNYYTNVDGNTVHSPAKSLDGGVPAGASARCRDGTYSFSQNRRGTCSHHGGVATWL